MLYFLKVPMDFFEAKLKGKSEFRLRTYLYPMIYAVGDTIVFLEYKKNGEYTGREARGRVSHICRGDVEGEIGYSTVEIRGLELVG